MWLLEEIICYPQVLSRERFIGQVVVHNLPGTEDAVNRAFDYYAATDANHINADAVRTELCGLRVRTEGIKNCTNKRVAHFDAKGPKDSPTILHVQLLWTSSTPCGKSTGSCCGRRNTKNAVGLGKHGRISFGNRGYRGSLAKRSSLTRCAWLCQESPASGQKQSRGQGALQLLASRRKESQCNCQLPEPNNGLS